MKRWGRAFVAMLALACFTAPPPTEAQLASKPPRVGVLLLGTPDTDPVLPSFRTGLRELGYVEGKDVVLEYRFAEGNPDRLPGLARELVNAKPDMVFAFGGDVAPFARTATSTIPIVMVVSVDPVQAGLVASLARPGGNITGVTFVSSDLAAKRLQLLKEMAPAVSRIGVLWNPDHVDPEYRETQAAGRALGVEVHSLEVRQPADFERAFRTAATARVEAVVVVSSRLMSLNRQLIADLATRQRILFVGGWGAWAQLGALFSYGPDLDVIVRHSASYVARVLKGARPAEIPVEQPTKFDLILNLKTAKAYGVTVPPGILARAEKIID
jgi:putative ABC transport system substrate-binding protein